MSNSIYNDINKPQPDPRINLVKQYNEFKQDPFVFFLQNRGINIPNEYRNDPQGAVQYLRNSGQMTQQQFEYITNLARTMGVKV